MRSVPQILNLVEEQNFLSDTHVFFSLSFFDLEKSLKFYIS